MNPTFWYPYPHISSLPTQMPSLNDFGQWDISKHAVNWGLISSYGLGRALLELWDCHDGMKSRKRVTMWKERPAVLAISAELPAASSPVSEFRQEQKKHPANHRIIRLNYFFKPLGSVLECFCFCFFLQQRLSENKNNW